MLLPVWCWSGQTHSRPRLGRQCVLQRPVARSMPWCSVPFIHVFSAGEGENSLTSPCPHCAWQQSAAAGLCPPAQPGSSLDSGPVFLSYGLGRGSESLVLWYRRAVLVALMSRAPPHSHLGPGPPAVEPESCPWPQKLPRASL